MSADLWYVDEDAERAEIKDENGSLVATAHDFDEARGICREHNSHDELLAALRETLPALIRLGDFIGNVDNPDVHARGTGIDRCALIGRVNAAIAKAEG